MGEVSGSQAQSSVTIRATKSASNGDSTSSLPHVEQAEHTVIGQLDQSTRQNPSKGVCVYQILKGLDWD